MVYKNVAVIYITDSDKTLLLKYNEDYCNKSKWSSPGGKIDRGESPYDAAVRELYEETGIFWEGDFDNYFTIKDTVIYIAYGRLRRVHLSEEHSNYVYFPLDCVFDIDLMSYSYRSFDFFFKNH